MNVGYRLAEIEDIEQVLALHARYQANTICEEDKVDGFITTAFTREELLDLVQNGHGLFVAARAGKIIAYAMAASWRFWSRWPMFKHMMKDLPNTSYEGYSLDISNSYQYGPVCVDKPDRGKGVFEKLFSFSRDSMNAKYPVLVTFINKINPRSLQAHTKKAGLCVIREFEYNSNHYYELACLTGPKI